MFIFEHRFSHFHIAKQQRWVNYKKVSMVLANIACFEKTTKHFNQMTTSNFEKPTFWPSWKFRSDIRKLQILPNNIRSNYQKVSLVLANIASFEKWSKNAIRMLIFEHQQMVKKRYTYVHF